MTRSADGSWTIKRWCLHAVLMGTVWLGAVVAVADVVTLTDGRVFEGRVTSQLGTVVEIDCVVHGVRATLKFNRSSVRRIDLGPLPAGFFDPKNKPSQKADATIDDGRPHERIETVPYSVLPLTGTLGEEVHADDVRKVLQRFKRTSNVVIIAVDSPGGYVNESEEIADALESFDDDFEYVALIQNAISAAVLPVLCADRIFLREGGTFGGAVSFIQSTGSVEVDAKMNSIWAARLEAEADRKGWSADVVRCMALLDRSLFAWHDDGRVHLGSVVPDGADSPQQVIHGTEILTISSDLARQIDFPEVVPSKTDAEQLGALVAPGKRWKIGSRYGFIVSDEARTNWEWFKEALATRDGLQRLVNQNMKDAIATDPDQQSYDWIWVDRWNEASNAWIRFRVPTNAAWSKWYGSTDRAIASWLLVAKNLDLLARIDNVAEYYHRSRLYDFEEMRQNFQRASREMNG